MILISGSSGFVGKYLCDFFRKKNLLFRIISRSQFHYLKFADNMGQGELQNGSELIKSLTEVDTIIHLAARVHVMNDKSFDPLSEFRRVNVEGTKNLARQAAKAGVKRFIFLSSIKVNGEASLPGKPFTADDIPNPEDAYAISKFEAEQALFEIADQSGMQVVIIRCPLVYGEGVKANFQTLMKLVRSGLPLPLGAVTENRRSLVAVDNLVDFIFTCISHPAAANQVFLVSDGEDLSTAELLHRMYKAHGSTDRLFKIPLSIMKIASNIAGKSNFYQRLCGSLQIDISKSRQILGWTPPVSVDVGLRRTFNGH